VLRCLGVDPGLGRLGFGIITQDCVTLRVERFGCIETPSHAALPERLLLLHEELCKIVENHTIHLVAVEQLFFGRNTTTAAMVWQARGVVLLSAAQAGIPTVEPKPSEVKLAVCGNGRAEKKQVQRMVRHLLGLAVPPKPDDAADALAIAIAGIALWRWNKGETSLV
jgi:crossover junction endodeoxyribonuclease RuvC